MDLHLLDNKAYYESFGAICLCSLVCGGHTAVANGSI